MISSISNAALLPTALQITNQAVAKASSPSTQKPQQAQPAEDTVHLSPQALAASRDADHDGDSH